MEQARSILSISDILNNSFQINKKYKFSVLISYLLWLLTCWIPYINLGTTIGLKSMIVKISKNENISAFDIFDESHRRNIGEFLTLSFMSYYVILFSISVFFVIPGLVMSLAWSQIYFLWLDKKIGVMESLKESYRITFNEKVELFLVKLSYLGIYIAVFVAFLLITLPAQIYLDRAETKYNRFQWGLKDDFRMVENIGYDVSDQKQEVSYAKRYIERAKRNTNNNVDGVTQKIEKLPSFRKEITENYEDYWGYSRTRRKTVTVELSGEELKKQKAAFEDEIEALRRELDKELVNLNVDLDREKVKLGKLESKLENAQKELEETINSGPSKPIISPWDYRGSKWVILAPIIGFFTTLFVIAFNASVSGYIYRRLREK